MSFIEWQPEKEVKLRRIEGEFTSRVSGNPNAGRTIYVRIEESEEWSGWVATIRPPFGDIFRIRPRGEKKLDVQFSSVEEAKDALNSVALAIDEMRLDPDPTIKVDDVEEFCRYLLTRMERPG